MTAYALKFDRIGGRMPRTMQTPIPPDSTPADELDAFFKVMDAIGAPYHAIENTDAYAVHLHGCNEQPYVWHVQIVEINNLKDKALEAYSVVIYDADGCEVDSSERAS